MTIRYLYINYYQRIRESCEDTSKDNSAANFIKHFINFNINTLLYLKRASTQADKGKNEYANLSLGKERSDSDFSDDQESSSEESSVKGKDFNDIVVNIVNENSESEGSFLKEKKLRDQDFSTFLAKFASNELKEYFGCVNEFKIFDEVLSEMKETDPNIHAFLLGSLSSSKARLLATIRQYKKLSFTQGAETNMKFRKIVKIKHN